MPVFSLLLRASKAPQLQIKHSPLPPECYLLPGSHLFQLSSWVVSCVMHGSITPRLQWLNYFVKILYGAHILGPPSFSSPPIPYFLWSFNPTYLILLICVFLPYSSAFAILLISYLPFFFFFLLLSLSGFAPLFYSCANREKNVCITEQQEERTRWIGLMCSSPAKLGNDDEEM